ncbi:MAG: alpha-N-arabinofuranosidase, partial [Prevotella sp.]|nr:alpha-N-arabinofuranosidase [Prevotella sp.]
NVRGYEQMPNPRIPLLNTSAAKTKDGSIVVSLSNISLDKAQEVSINLDGMTAKTVSGEILTCKTIADYNDFEHPDNVKPAAFKDAKLKKNVLTVKIPAKSIVVLNIK